MKIVNSIPSIKLFLLLTLYTEVLQLRCSMDLQAFIQPASPLSTGRSKSKATQTTKTPNQIYKGSKITLPHPFEKWNLSLKWLSL